MVISWPWPKQATSNSIPASLLALRSISPKSSCVGKRIRISITLAAASPAKSTSPCRGHRKAICPAQLAEAQLAEEQGGEEQAQDSEADEGEAELSEMEALAEDYISMTGKTGKDAAALQHVMRM